jgi:hypothetical protein
MSASDQSQNPNLACTFRSTSLCVKAQMAKELAPGINVEPLTLPAHQFPIVMPA